MKKSSTGFTLIELMIVIAIIGILMAYAIPAYKDYTTRSKAGECVSIMNGAKVSISERWNATTSLTAITDNPSALISNSITGANVGSVVVTAPGIITCTYASADSDLNGETIILTPTAAIGSVSLTWLCTHSAGLALQHVPGGC